MEIFNRERSEYEEIVAISPKWWTEYREMDAVYRYEGWCLDLMAYFLDRSIKNLFPSQADERSLIIYERLLRIEHDIQDTIEERRRVVQAYYSGTGKLSRSVIQSIVKAYGDCDCEVSWLDHSSLRIRIICNDDKLFSNKRIYQIIERRFPAHLSFIISNILCNFFTAEEINYNKITHRTSFGWWDAPALDGKYFLDGTLKLDVRIPPFFVAVQKISVENEEQIFFGMLCEKFNCITSSNAGTLAKHRTLMNWWEGRHTLDGRKNLDGTWLLNQDMPPYLLSQTYKTTIQNEEIFSVSMYVPGRDKNLDGTWLLDGSIKLNSGKEEL